MVDDVSSVHVCALMNGVQQLVSHARPHPLNSQYTLPPQSSPQEIACKQYVPVTLKAKLKLTIPR